jgi:hypothetical protein
MAATPKCIIDRAHPCGGCVADSPATCPYVYLLADDAVSPVTDGSSPMNSLPNASTRA